MNQLVALPLAATAIATPTVSAAADPSTDPIFVVINAHKEAAAAHSECVRIHYALEETLPVETDDPRWIETMRAVDRACDEMFDLAYRLLDIAPSSLAGASALLNHAADSSGDDGWMFPEYVVVDDDETEEEYVPALMRHVGEALRRIGASET